MPLLFRGERLMRFGQCGILINIRRQLFQIFQVICGRECRLPFAITMHILSIRPTDFLIVQVHPSNPSPDKTG